MPKLSHFWHLLAPSLRRVVVGGCGHGGKRTPSSFVRCNKAVFRRMGVRVAQEVVAMATGESSRGPLRTMDGALSNGRAGRVKR